MSKLTHLDDNGQAHMVDVGAKDVTERTATAEAVISMLPDTLRLILDGGHKRVMYLPWPVSQESRRPRNALILFLFVIP